MKLGFLVDLDLCMGCKACEVSCKAENNVPLNSWRLRVKYVDTGVFPDTKRDFTPLRCNHCENAPCERICPVSALHYLDNGIVNVDKERCIGCAACMMACPYGAIYMDPVTNTADLLRPPGRSRHTTRLCGGVSGRCQCIWRSGRERKQDQRIHHGTPGYPGTETGKRDIAQTFLCRRGPDPYQPTGIQPRRGL